MGEGLSTLERERIRIGDCAVDGRREKLDGRKSRSKF